MKSILIGFVRWLATAALPEDWIRAKIKSIILHLLTRLFDMADALAKRTEMTDIDDKAATALRSWLGDEKVISHFVDFAFSLLMGTPTPAPVDPVNPPPVPVTPASPGIFKRLMGGFKGFIKSVIGGGK